MGSFWHLVVHEMERSEQYVCLTITDPKWQLSGVSFWWVLSESERTHLNETSLSLLFDVPLLLIN